MPGSRRALFTFVWALLLSIGAGEGCPGNCTSHGKCQEGFCECQSGWAGEDCGYFLLSSTDEDDGFPDAAVVDGVAEDGGCPGGCSSHGTCEQGACSCSPGWGGTACDVRAARQDIPCAGSCSDHGICRSGICECAQGWFGSSCNERLTTLEVGSATVTAALPLPEPLESAAYSEQPCRQPCASGSGRCLGGQCYCAPGYGGADCSRQLASATPEEAPPNPVALEVMERQVGSMEAELLKLQGATDKADHQPALSRGSAGAAEAPEPVPRPPREAQVYAEQVRRALYAAKLSTLKVREAAAKLGEVSEGHVAVREAGRSVQRLLLAAQRPVAGREAVPRPPTHAGAPPTPEAVPSRASAAATHSTAGSAKANATKAATPGPHRSQVSQVKQALYAAALLAKKLQEAAANLDQPDQVLSGQAGDKGPGAASPPPMAAAHAATAPGPKASGKRASPLATTATAEPVAPVAAILPPAPTVPRAPAVLVLPLAYVAPAALPPAVAGVLVHDPDNEDSVSEGQLAEEDALRQAAVRLSAAALSERRSGGAAFAVPLPSKQGTACQEDCNGHGKCVSTPTGLICRCEPGWVGMLCDIPRCPGDCYGNGLCMMGRCVCDKDWHGESCGMRRCPEDCSGAGYCFRGVCQCSSGFGGPNCAELRPTGQTLAVKLQHAPAMKAPAKVDAFAVAASLRAVVPKSCTDDCNNHGKCNGWGECECMAGYSGNACEIYCPNECTHQGECVEGACLCFAGFLGDDCSVSGCCSGHGSCEDPTKCICEAGWGGHECSMKLLCEDPTCSGHGFCSEGSCHCSLGFMGPTCSLPSGGCHPACSEHGMCNADTKSCDCEEGFTGATCEGEVQLCPNMCSSKGLCLNGECMCGAGWAGEDCSQRHFTPGMSVAALKAPPEAVGVGAMGPLSGRGPGVLDASVPVAASPAPAASFLSRGGVAGGPRPQHPVLSLAQQVSRSTGLSRDNSGMAGTLVTPQPLTLGADAQPNGLQLVERRVSESPFDSVLHAVGEYFGLSDSAADIAAARFAGQGQICGVGGLCSGHGACNESVGRCVCMGRWRGDECEVQGCPGFAETGKDCNGHGICQAGACICAAGWGMLNQNLSEAQNACADNVCPADCGDHGVCLNGQCRCHQGWEGPNCRNPQCPGGCSGHGVCNLPSVHAPGECLCNYGWGGSSCNRRALYYEAQACPGDCSGNGLCFNGMCACNVGFTGAACDQVSCLPGMTGPRCELSRCPNDCSGQGLCYQGVCSCLEGFMGQDCGIPQSCYHQCRYVCAPEAASPEKCNFCVASCTTAVHNFPLGRHNPFEDLQATLLQAPDGAAASQPLPSPRGNATLGSRGGAPGQPAPGPRRRRRRRGHHREVSAMRLAATGPPSVARRRLGQLAAASASRAKRKHLEVSVVRLQVPTIMGG